MNAPIMGRLVCTSREIPPDPLGYLQPLVSMTPSSEQSSRYRGRPVPHYTLVTGKPLILIMLIPHLFSRQLTGDSDCGQPRSHDGCSCHCPEKKIASNNDYHVLIIYVGPRMQEPGQGQGMQTLSKDECSQDWRSTICGAGVLTNDPGP